MALTETSNEVRSLIVKAMTGEILLYVGYHQAIFWNVISFVHVLINGRMRKSQRRNRIPSDKSYGTIKDDKTREDLTVGLL
jgi:hypothetical protein